MTDPLTSSCSNSPWRPPGAPVNCCGTAGPRTWASPPPSPAPSTTSRTGHRRREADHRLPRRTPPRRRDPGRGGREQRGRERGALGDRSARRHGQLPVRTAHLGGVHRGRTRRRDAGGRRGGADAPRDVPRGARRRRVRQRRRAARAARAAARPGPGLDGLQLRRHGPQPPGGHRPAAHPEAAGHPSRRVGRRST